MTDQAESAAAPPRQWGKSILAVFLGLVAVFVLSLGTDAVMHALDIFPPMGRPMSDNLFLLATAYRLAYGIVGGYIAARFMPDRAVGHALALGLIGLILSVAGAVATWDAGPEFGPHWYPLALVVTAIPCALAGGWLFLKSRAVR